MILVLGGTGFLGKHVCDQLLKANKQFEASSLSLGVDLEDYASARNLVAETKPEFIINCAAYVGGIEYGYNHPVELFEKNLKMSINILKVANEFKVSRLVNPISNCAYPSKATLFREDEFWDGPLHESVLVYGFVRKAMCIGSWAYSKQHNLDVINLIMSNMYGPDDHFEESRSHAVGALIMKFSEAKINGRPFVSVWGTGRPVREWLYVKEGAEALVRAVSCPAMAMPVNVGVGKGLPMTDIVSIIKEAVGYTGEVIYDLSKPDGAPYKTVDGSIGAELLGWRPSMNIKDGITQTVEWYIKNRQK